LFPKLLRGEWRSGKIVLNEGLLSYDRIKHLNVDVRAEAECPEWEEKRPVRY